MENPAPLTCALPERVATVGEGIKDSLPIVISYLPVAFAFGLNATRLGFTRWKACSSPALFTPAPASL